MDVFLLIVTIVISLLLIVVNIYLLAVYCHPDDTGFGASLFCKFLVVFGLTLSWAQVLMLPLDVGNSRGQGGGLDMAVFWQIIYALVTIMCVILIPFAIFFYESDEDKSFGGRLRWAFFSTLGMLIIVALIIFISYIFLSKADIPYYLFIKDITNASDSGVPLTDTSVLDQYSQQSLELDVSFIVYCMAVMSLCGWFLFVLFGGVGITALPMDLIHEYKSRPIFRSPRELADKQIELRKKCTELIQLGKQIENEKDNVKVESGWWSKRKANQKLTKSLNKFKADVFNLEKESGILQLEKNLTNVNPLIFIGKLILGIVMSIISIVWLLHILLYVLIRENGVPINLFLNNLFIGLEQANLGFAATISFAAFSLYLLWCIQKGNMKFGLRIFIISIHPMKVNETWMNSFLFNVLLILLSSVSVTQFVAQAFSQYTRLTTIDLIFGTQIKYMRFFSFFYKNQIFEYALFIWSIISGIYLLLRPKDKIDVEKEYERRHMNL